MRATHDFSAAGEGELSVEAGQILLVQAGHLDDARGWIFAVPVEAGLVDPDANEGGYVPLSYLTGPIEYPEGGG